VDQGPSKKLKPFRPWLSKRDLYDKQGSIEELNAYDCVVVSDYDKGYVSHKLLYWLQDNYTGWIFLDTKKTNLEGLTGKWVIKINALEKSRLTSFPDAEKSEAHMIITNGAGPVEHWGPWNHPTIQGEQPKMHEVPPTEEVVDVCGAGDTFLAQLALSYLEVGIDNMGSMIREAIAASMVTCQHIGVRSPSRAEVLEMWMKHFSPQGEEV
jgi:bifunctional ADP-heptose synthase (sugar kinase/adenylyltransferase)